jgi:hypothetical protein
MKRVPDFAVWTSRSVKSFFTTPVSGMVGLLCGPRARNVLAADFPTAPGRPAFSSHLACAAELDTRATRSTNIDVDRISRHVAL